MFLDRLFGHKGPWSRRDISTAVEGLIAEVDPKVGLLPNAKERLYRGVRETLNYTAEKVSVLPKPLDLSPAGFSSDRRVGLVFATPESLSALLLRSEALHEYFSHPSNPDRAYLLLVGQPNRRSKMGSQLLPDGSIQNDVPLEVVSFEQARIMAVYDSLASLQQWAGMEAYRAMCRDLARRMQSQDACRKRLEAERQRVLLRIAAHGQHTVNADALRERHDVADDQLPQRLNELDIELAVCAGRQTLTGKLDWLWETVRKPADYLQIHSETVWLDRMGVISPHSPDATRLDMALVELGDTDARERVVFPAVIDRHDLPVWRERWPVSLA